MKLFLNVFLSLGLVCIHSLVLALDLPTHHPVPGGIALVKLEINSIQRPTVHYNKKQVMVVKYDDDWFAIVGLSLSSKAGDKQLTSTLASQSKKHHFIIQAKEYESQYITIKNKRKVNPEKRDMVRIGKETRQITRALSHWSNISLDNKLQLDLPVEGRLSSPFGLRRYFNEQPRKPHSGVDIAAPTGTPIKTPANGKVILTGDFFFNGNSVFIDHGQGLITMYCHMDSIDVEIGQPILRGQIIGNIGMTGRVTGPHLHWSISLNDARIDPNLIVPALKELSEN